MPSATPRRVPTHSAGSRSGARAWTPSALALALLAGAAHGQLVFSIDYKGVTKGQADGTGAAIIRESDVLFLPAGPAPGPLPNPHVFRSAQQVGMPAAAACTTSAGFPCGAELDALSFGNDRAFDLNPDPNQRARLFFSVDYRGLGVPTPGTPPSLFTEALAGEVASDIFTPQALPLLYLAPTPPPPRIAQVLDGDGLPGTGASARRRGLGLVEPHARFDPPQPVVPPWLNPGDDLDALHISGAAPGRIGIFFSVDGARIDPRTTIPGSNTAAQISPTQRPGSILLVPFNGATTATEWASPDQLGLDRNAPGEDDLDVIILRENGVPGFQRATGLYGWLPPPAGNSQDMLLFSVRSGSAIIGVVDSILGLPIEPGDLLVPPLGPTPLASLPPGIAIRAEHLGLRTQRTGALEADDLDGGSTGEVCYDCNNNGIEDAVDISSGSSADVNGNGIPDECESSYTAACHCPMSAPPPCSNDDAGAGCRNSTGVGGLLTPTGTTSVATDDLVLTATQLPPPATGLWLRSSSTQAAAPLKDGLLCLGAFLRFGTDGPGTAAKGPGMVASVSAGANPMLVGSTWHFQYYYRNVVGPCLQGGNVTNMVSVTWTP